MEAFSLLKYWRTSGGGGGITDLTLNPKPVNAVDPITTTTTHNDANNSHSNDDDGPFFDLEFSLDDDDDDDDDEGNENDTDIDENDDDDDTKSTKSESENDDGEEEREFKFTPSSGDLFFNGKLVPIESPNDSDQPSSNNRAQFPVSSLLKSATRFRVFMSGFNKKSSSKSHNNGVASEIASTNNSNNGDSIPASNNNSTNGNNKKLFTVKFKVEEVPIVSLFTRDNSSRASSKVKQGSEVTEGATMAANPNSNSEEKRFSKEAMQRYLKKVKPLYVRVSRRRLAGHVSVEASPAKAKVAEAAAAEVEVPDAAAVVVSSGGRVGGLNLPAGLRVVCKHLGKSRSASSMVVAAVPAGNAAAGRRRDDSLIQQQDGIQSAILHCKRSFNSTRDSQACLLSRCTSDPSNNEKKCLDLSRKSADGIQRP